MKKQAAKLVNQPDLFDGIRVDCFAGGGGWSIGMAMALGQEVDIAINHDAAAVAMHEANHPFTRHYCKSIYDVGPREVVGGRPVSWAHFSPDCRHFSNAKGGVPVKKEIRDLPWVILSWAGTVKPAVISFENVSEFQKWGPLIAKRDPKTGHCLKIVSQGKKGLPTVEVAEKGEVVPYCQQYLIPDKKREGETFRKFVRALRKLGYEVEFKKLVACDYGAATKRERLFGVFRRDGRPIVWPQPTHGAPDSHGVWSGELLSWKTTADIIDWSLSTPSIFASKREIKEEYGLNAVRPLAQATMGRIAKGLNRFVLTHNRPFIVCSNHRSEEFRGQSIDEPLSTLTAKLGYGLVKPALTPYHMHNHENAVGTDMREPLNTVMTNGAQMFIAPALVQYHGEQASGDVRGQEVERPLSTVDCSNRHALTMSVLAEWYGNTPGGQPLGEPLPTITTKGHHALLAAHCVKMKGDNLGHPVSEPIQSITAGGTHFGLVTTRLVKVEPGVQLYYWPEIRAMLNKHCGYDLADDELLLLEIGGALYFLADIGLRMLTPRELFNASGFPADYIIDRDAEGNPIGKTEQVHRCGNAVPPPFALHLVRANIPEQCRDVPARTVAEVIEQMIA